MRDIGRFVELELDEFFHIFIISVEGEPLSDDGKRVIEAIPIAASQELLGSDLEAIIPTDQGIEERASERNLGRKLDKSTQRGRREAMSDYLVNLLSRVDPLYFRVDLHECLGQCFLVRLFLSFELLQVHMEKQININVLALKLIQ